MSSQQQTLHDNVEPRPESVIGTLVQQQEPSQDECLGAGASDIQSTTESNSDVYSSQSTLHNFTSANASKEGCQMMLLEDCCEQPYSDILPIKPSQYPNVQMLCRAQTTVNANKKQVVLEHAVESDLLQLKEQRHSPSKDGIEVSAALSKHEQRKLNLKRKRAREQIMQVVESYINEQTIIAAFQSFVEAHFINDMMNESQDVMNRVITKLLKEVIQEVLKEIYVANSASLLLEKVVIKELQGVCGECLGQEMKENLDEQSLAMYAKLLRQTIEVSVNEQVDDCLHEEIAQTIVEEGIQNMLLKEVVSEISQVIVNEQSENALEGLLEGFLVREALDALIESFLCESQLPRISSDQIQAAVDEMLIEQEITQHLIDQEIASCLINEVSNEVIAQSLTEQFLHESLQHEVCMIINDCALYNTVEQSVMFNMIIEIFHECKASISRKQNQYAMAIRDDLVEGFMGREIARMFGREIQLEYIAQGALDKVINQVIVQEIYSDYQEQQLHEQVFQELIMEVLGSLVQSEVVVQQKVEAMQEDVAESVIMSATLSECYSISYSQLLSCNAEQVAQLMVKQIAAELVESKVEESCLMEEVFDQMLREVLLKEIKFEIQLQQDAQMLTELLFGNFLVNETQLDWSVPVALEQTLRDEVTHQELQAVATDVLSLQEQTNEILDELAYQMILEMLVETNEQEQQRRSQRSLNFSQHSKYVMLTVEKPTTSSTNKPTRDNKEYLSPSSDRGNFDKAVSLFHQQVLNQCLKQFLTEIINSLTFKLIVEHCYKRIMSRVLKRNIYSIIQSSVDIIYNLEEDTISTANKVLDNFILTMIDQVICEEITINQDSGVQATQLIEGFLGQELANVVQEVTNPHKQLCKPSQRVKQITVRGESHRKSRGGGGFIRIDEDDGCISIGGGACGEQGLTDDSAVSGDADIFSDQDEKATIIVSPSRKPDFKRNILQNSKSVQNSLNKYHNNGQGRGSDKEREKGPGHQRMASELEQRAIKFVATNAAMHLQQQDQQQQQQNEQTLRIRKSMGSSRQKKTGRESPTARYYLNQIQINQEVEDLDRFEVDSEGEDDQLQLQSKAKAKRKSAEHSRSVSNCKSSLKSSIVSQSVAVAAFNEACKENKRVSLAGCSNGSQDELCTLRSDDDEDKVCDNMMISVNQHEPSSRNSSKQKYRHQPLQTTQAINETEDRQQTSQARNKRVAQVKARQPKEGIKFIEIKNSQQNSVISYPQEQQQLYTTSGNGGKEKAKVLMKVKNTITIPTQEQEFTNMDSYREGTLIAALNINTHQKTIQLIPHHSKDSSSSGEFVNYASDCIQSPTIGTLKEPLKPPSFDTPQSASNHLQPTTPSSANSQGNVKLDEGQLNLSLEKLVISLNQRFLEIRRTNPRSVQLSYLQVLQQLAQQVLSCGNNRMDQLFDIDQQLKEILIKLSADTKHQQEYFQVILMTNQLALLNYQKVSCLVDKKQQPPLLLQQQTPVLRPKTNSFSSATGKVSSYKRQAVTSSQQTKKSVERTAGTSQQNQQHLRIQQVQPFNVNPSSRKESSASSSASNSASSIQQKPHQNMQIKPMNSPYFSNLSNEKGASSNGNTNNNANVTPIDLTIFKQKDQQYILKCIGKIDSQGLTPSNVRIDSVSCGEFQKRQFYLMTLYHVMRKKLKPQQKEIISVEDLFTRMKSDKVHQKDWKEFIEKSLVHLEFPPQLQNQQLLHK